MTELTPAEAMAAFDQLPVALRDELNNGPFRLRPEEVLAALRSGVNVGTALHMIRRSWQKYVDLAGRRWRGTHCGEYPHIGAGATLMFAEPVEGREPDEPSGRTFRHRSARRLRRLPVERAAPKPEKSKAPAVILL